MSWKVWRWVISAIAILQLIVMGIRAFSIPWSGTSEQWLTLAFAVALALWIFAWLFLGSAELKKRLALVQELRSQPARPWFRNIGVWVFVAVMLVFIFNLMQH